MRILLIAALCAGASMGQSLKGIVDLHVHSDPDSAPRSIDALEAARICKQEGMRALLLKNHNAPTYPMAYIVAKAVPGIEVYGGLVLNRAVGGINPAAVEQAAKFKGGFAKVVWMPTFDAGSSDRPPNRPYVPVSKGGKLLPEVIEVLQLMAKYNLALATGHSTAQEHLMLTHEARKAGITRIILTHPSGVMTNDQMKEAAAEGAFVELVYHSLLGGGRLTIESYAETIRAVGAEHCILSSDLGQNDSPVHPVGWKKYIEMLKKAGISDAQIDLMARKNPAKLLGLD